LSSFGTVDFEFILVTRQVFQFRFVAAMLIVVVFAVAVRAALPDVGAQARAVTELRSQYETLSTKYARDAGEWRPAAPGTGSLLFVAPDEYSTAGRKKSVTNPNAESHLEYADALFLLAKRAAGAGQLSLAFQWATETLRENPDHADARRVLGYEKHGGKWLTPYGARMAQSGKEWHAKFGWLAPGEASRYEAGERLVGKRWVTVDEDAARHREMKAGWQVRTDHFLVTTNHSLEAAAELAARLERLHQVWRQLFAGFYLTQNEVQRLFAGERQPRKQVRPFRVYYHRDRGAYVAALGKRQPRIGETLGIYFDVEREAHFFAGDDQDLSTLYHEAVHQLFQETKPAAKRVGNLANFWAVEGVATYFETLGEHNEPAAGRYYTIGEAHAGRLPAARERLKAGYFVPLAELTQMGKDDLQRRDDIIVLYGEAAGVAAFLMDGENGRYREPLVKYLDAIYAGRDNDRSLAEAAETGYDELDSRYRRHMESLP
jgi:hypothetical protein